MRKKRLYRTKDGAIFSGVCVGIANFLEVDPTIVRLLWIVISIFTTVGIGGLIAYIICAFIMPLQPTNISTHSKEDVWEADDFRVKDEDES